MKKYEALIYPKPEYIEVIIEQRENGKWFWFCKEGSLEGPEFETAQGAYLGARDTFNGEEDNWIRNVIEINEEI